MAKVSKIDSEQYDEMGFWTKGEHLRLNREVMDKPQSFTAFELLYWCVLRLGEMLAPRSLQASTSRAIGRSQPRTTSE